MRIRSEASDGHRGTLRADWASPCVATDLGQTEWLHARFVAGRYARHSHAAFVIGVVESGVEGFRYRGARRRAGPGDVVMLDPDEGHDGYPEADHFQYRMLYPSPDWLADLLARPSEALHFREPVVRDPALAQSLARAHRLVGGGPSLARDTALVASLDTLVARYGARGRDAGGSERARPHAHRELDTARAYIEAHVGSPLTLADLARASGLPTATLVRSFTRRFGLPPHAYQLSRRIERARVLLRRGWPIAEVAQALGFGDQAHLTWHFRARAGVTPGQYQRVCKNVQDG